jgi:hypothetical protein
MTAAARGPGTCPRCFVRARPHRACARPDLRAPSANPRAGSLGLAAGLLERAYSRRGEAGLSAEWFVAMLRSLSGMRSISSSMPATDLVAEAGNEILPRGGAALLCGSLTDVRTLPSYSESCRAAARAPSLPIAGRRASQRPLPELSSPRTSEETPSNVDLASRWMRTTCRRSWRTGLRKPRRSRSMPWRAGHPRRLTSQMRGAAPAGIAWRSGLRRA